MAELALTMPKMSMTMEEGTMVTWLKNEGDPVKSGDPVCEVTTDKVEMEVESPYDGVLARITAQVDDVVKVGDPIGFITTEADDLLGGLFDEPADEAPSEAAAPAPTTESTPASDVPAADVDQQERADSDWVAAVPRARTLAAEKGIDLRSVKPSGPWGAVRASDVDGSNAATSPDQAPPAEAPPAKAPPADQAEGRRRRTRLQVAKVMSASASVPQFTAYRDVDLVTLARVRKTDLGGASWTALLVRAQAIALRALPELNAVWTDSGSQLNSEIGIALAVDSPSGLLAPVLRNPDQGTLAELSMNVSELVKAARTGSVTADQMSGGTTVFSNLGGMGVDSFNALLTPPHATALSAGAVRERIVVSEDGAFGARLGCTLGLTLDHRVADGADAARFLATVNDVLNDPRRILTR